ncbi:MAG: RusA family crossover junction endodeoxyribonuclease [Comamonadaceae bacterium]|nr:MAG: RusA family crossover junction endodeoxyribonuclease [Comamonadaceae bacterium]
MTYELTFTVPGQPYGKGRPRVGRVNGRARMFTPTRTVNYEGLVAWTAQAAMAGRALFEGPVQVNMHLVCKVPASWSKKKQAQALNLEILPTTKPDIDNCVKAVFDAMNGVVWKDDVQCCSVCVAKRYGATPGVRVDVMAL